MSLTRVALTDDDGSRTTGTIFNNAWLTAEYDLLDARWSEATTTATGTQNNLAFADADTIRANNATALTITGLVAPASPAKPGKPLRIVAIGAGSVTLTNQDTGSTAANRIVTSTGAALTLAAGTGSAILVYDGTSSVWRVLASSALGAAPVIQTTTSTGTQNDFALSTGAALLRANNATALTLTGLSAGAAGQPLMIVAIGAGTVALNDQDAGSSAANRLITGTGAAITLAAGTGWAALVYDATTGRWRVLGSSASAGGVDPGLCEGRLTLTSGTPVTTADVTGATNLYWTPMGGGRMALYDGSSAWTVLTFAELTQALGTLVNGQAYDVFAYNNSGAVALELLEWMNATVTLTIAAPGVVTWTAHGLSTGQVVIFTTSGALPTGVSANTVYFVTVVDANSFKLSTTMANLVASTFITTTGSQSGTHTGHNPQARQTAIGLQNGVPVKAGATTRRLLATVLASSTTTTEDSVLKRFVSNYYNRAPRRLRRQDSTASWTSTGLTTFRQANNNTAANQVETVACAAELVADLSYQSPTVQDSTASLTAAQAGIGIDSITTAQEACTIVSLASSASQLSASVRALIAMSAGYHRLTMLEKGGNGAGTTTWYGGSTYTGAATLSGVVMA